MKKQLLALSLFLLLIPYSGCIELLEKEQIYTYKHYKLNTKISEFKLTLPDEAAIPNNVELTIIYPDGDHSGVYRKYTDTLKTTFYPNNITLYQTGIYTLKYVCGDLIKYEYFFVGNVDRRLVFRPTRLWLNNSFVRLQVLNDGNIDGFLNIALITNEVVAEGSKTIYGKSFLNKVEYIKNGHCYEFEYNIGVDSAILLINYETYEL
jgi:hypothetical protein